MNALISSLSSFLANSFIVHVLDLLKFIYTCRYKQQRTMIKAHGLPLHHLFRPLTLFTLIATLHATNAHKIRFTAGANDESSSPFRFKIYLFWSIFRRIVLVLYLQYSYTSIYEYIYFVCSRNKILFTCLSLIHWLIKIRSRKANNVTLERQAQVWNRVLL